MFYSLFTLCGCSTGRAADTLLPVQLVNVCYLSCYSLPTVAMLMQATLQSTF